MFSVLVPSYNHRRFLVDAVLSALRSPLVTELLIVDDGSTDRSRELLPVLCDLDPRVRVLDEACPSNLGAHARLNQLVATASAEWLSVLNSDDLFASGRFEAIAQTVATAKADAIFGDLVVINGEGVRQGLRNSVRHNEIAWPIGWDAQDLANRGEWLKLLAVQNIVATTTNLVFSKKIFKNIGGFREYRYCHDWDFVLRSALLGRLQYAPLMLSMYRLHGSNTIKEGRRAVTIEVLKMFRNLLQDYPGLRRDSGFGDGLRFNPYICSSCAPLVVVMPVSTSLDLRQAISGENLLVQFVERVEEIPPGVRYIYAPTGDPSLLSPNELRNLVLAIAVRPYDAFLVSRTRDPYPAVGAASLADLVVSRIDAAADWATGNVRVLRSYTAAVDPRPVGELVDLANAAVDTAFLESAVAKDWKPVVQLAQPAEEIAGDTLPVVFVLPAFLALGGAERLVIDTMRFLTDKYRFVVVNTESLRPEQGSLHQEAVVHAHVYDLAEIVRRADRLKAFELLKEWYSPALIWICNGSPWQIEHSLAIRTIFSDLPIVDNQAYDHEQGWIAHYNQPGVRAANRFVAVNGKIRDAMISKYRIPADQIDLVYHGFDPCRTKRPDAAVGDNSELRARFGLPRALPIFGMVGRLSAQKRPLDLVRLAERLQKMDYPAHLVWVGSGELDADFMALAEGLRLRNISRIPAQDDVEPVFAMLSGLVITSAFEGLPVVMLEALSMGIPILSTDVGAIAEVLDRFGSGMVFEPIGDINALEQAFYKFVTNLDAFRDCALQTAPALVENFSSYRMAREYDFCFQTAIASPARRGHLINAT